jgi:hypothetical protein
LTPVAGLFGPRQAVRSHRFYDFAAMIAGDAKSTFKANP